MIVKVLVKPNSKKGSFLEESDNEYDYVAFVKQKPEDGKANAALIKMLAKHFKRKKADITIKTGKTSKIKLIHID
jgi:uncharacterized protein (TIGR00251 family)